MFKYKELYYLQLCIYIQLSLYCQNLAFTDIALRFTFPPLPCPFNNKSDLLPFLTDGIFNGSELFP